MSNNQGKGTPPRDPEKVRGYNLKHLFKITPEQYDQKLAEQDGRCAICLRFMEKPHMDHDHRCCPGRRSCGECLRGLICFSCNTGLGHFTDDPAVLRLALNYLETYK